MTGPDDETCIACGLCEELLPQFFVLVDGTVRVRGPESLGPREREAALAVAGCADGALFLD